MVRSVNTMPIDKGGKTVLQPGTFALGLAQVHFAALL